MLIVMPPLLAERVGPVIQCGLAACRLPGGTTWAVEVRRAGSRVSQTNPGIIEPALREIAGRSRIYFAASLANCMSRSMRSSIAWIADCGAVNALTMMPPTIWACDVTDPR